MSSVLRSVRKRKKGRTLGAVDVIDREEYAELEVDAKVELIRSLVPLGLMHIEELLDEEVTALAGDRAINDRLLKRVLHGISCRNYEAAAEAIPGAIGLSGSTVSRGFIQASAAQLRELQERDLSGEDVVALVLDGKTFAEATMVVALGITMTGDKRFLGVVVLPQGSWTVV